MNNTTQPSLKEALKFWFKLGFISFGGPAGQIATMHTELVERKRWISEKNFLHALNYCMVLPGPEAQQLATYLGWLMHSTWGGIAAGALFVLPSLFILITLSWIYLSFQHLALIANIFYAIKPAVVMIVLHAAFRIGHRALKTKLLWGVAAGSLITTSILDWPFPLIVLLAGTIGWLSQSKRDTKAETSQPQLSNIRYDQLARHLMIGLALWIIPVGLMILIVGWQHTYTQLSWFFTKAALLTFGGAYSVLPYVFDASVNHYQWLSASQMLDGLALGETTPGPLIMIVAFVGYIAGHSQHLLGQGMEFGAGALGAAIATWFTFLPSFLFILIGAPFVERTQESGQLAAPLNAISAAVIGVIINLALYFAYHVYWPTGLHSTVDFKALALSALAAVLLFKLKWSMTRVVLCFAGIGLAMTAINALT